MPIPQINIKLGQLQLEPQTGKLEGSSLSPKFLASNSIELKRRSATVSTAASTSPPVINVSPIFDQSNINVCKDAELFGSIEERTYSFEESDFEDDDAYILSEEESEDEDEIYLRPIPLQRQRGKIMRTFDVDYLLG